MTIDANAIVRPFRGNQPLIDVTAYIAPSAVIIGRVTIGPNVSVWPGAVLRGDECAINVGKGSNIQDGVVIHGDPDNDVVIGESVTIGHRAVVHGCIIDEGALIGMGAIVLDHARVGARALVGANSLVTAGKVVPSQTLWMGSPAKQIRELDDQAAQNLLSSAYGYMKLFAHYLES